MKKEQKTILLDVSDKIETKIKMENNNEYTSIKRGRKTEKKYS
jgi:hypothetical protein